MYEFAVTPAVTQLRRPGVTIESVEPGSIASELDLRPGDRIVKVNGRNVRDYLDFRFQTSGETGFVILVRRTDSEAWEIDLERDEGEDLGLNFEQIIPRQCANECIFCFCKGNPEDARPSLFVRDEDIRLSFLYGNYTTLTSITEDEMNRVIEQRLSPQYVSVHATDLETRAYLLGVDEARADISGKLERLLENNISVHAQVVLCPGINDGAILGKTLADLADLHPGVVSAAVVPVALTRYNRDTRLTRVTGEFCRKVIEQVSRLQAGFEDLLGTKFVYLGDEIYLKGGAAIPRREHYGDYPQIEDGVGMVRSFEEGFESVLSEIRVNGENGASGKNRSAEPLRGTIFTGEMFAPVLSEMIGKYNAATGDDIDVKPVPNTYFGGDVSVAGLLTGQDLIAMREQARGEFAVVPSHIVKSDEPVLLDGMTPDEIRNAFRMPVLFLDPDGLNALLLRDDPLAEDGVEIGIS